MKTSIYFLSVIISTYFGSVFLMQTNSDLTLHTNTNSSIKLIPEWKKNYLDCEKIIDSIKSNNKITKKNFNFVEQQLTEIK